MITHEEALKKVLSQSRDYGVETIALKTATGRILAEDIHADRDFPASDRSTRDGIAISYNAFENGRTSYNILGTLAAGDMPEPISDKDGCIEIMTGASIPLGVDTVVPYEHITIQKDIATVDVEPKSNQFIHREGSDGKKGDLLIKSGKRLGPGDIGVLAAVGKAQVAVKKWPRMAVISTGDELIPVNESPRAHQLRRSNIYSLNAALSGLGIEPLMLHLADDPDIIRQKMQYLLGERDVIVISGGVSKGKYDHIPQILEELQVETIFHRVKQRPGKPFLFGMNKRNKALVFAFPGNPVSTFFNYHLYFIPWFNSIYKIDSDQAQVKLATDIEVKGDLLQLIGVRLNRKNNEWQAEIPKGQHSGNLIGLSGIDGFIKLDPKNAPFKKNDRVTFTKIYPW